MKRFLFISAPFGGIEVLMANLKKIVGEMPDIDATWLFLRPGDEEWFTQLPLVNRNLSLKLGLLARSKVQKLLEHGAEFDAIFSNSLPLLTFMQGIRRRIPTILWIDCTPEMVNTSGRWYREPSASRMTVRRKLQDAFHTDRVYSDAALIVAWSETARLSLLEDYRVDFEKVFCIPPGILASEWLDCARSTVGTKTIGHHPRVLFVGGDFARKGGELLLSVADRPEFRSTDFHFVTGYGRNTGLRNVFFHGGVTANSPELRSLYRSADVFALPTNADFAPTNAICEAMASGLPVITTRVGGLDEVIRDGDNGFVIEPGDRATLADRLHRLLDSPSIRRRMGATGQLVAAEEFDLRRNFQKLLHVVDRTLVREKAAAMGKSGVKEASIP